MDRGSRGRRGRGSGITRAPGSDRDRALVGTDVWRVESLSPSAHTTPTSTPSQRGRADGSHGAADVHAPRATPKSDRPAKTSGNPSTAGSSGSNGSNGSNGSAHSNQNMQHSFTFSTPANTRGPVLRKRARTFDFGLDAAADDENEAEVKGGHSLRKRMRVDYAQMHDDDATDETAVQDAPSAAKTPSASVPRGRKRRVDDDSDDFAGSSSAPKKRSRLEKRTESPAASRRKQQRSRKSSTPTQSHPHADQPSDTELKDTIEVGVILSDQDSDEPRPFNQFSDSASVTSRESDEEALVLPRASPSEAALERRDTRDAGEPVVGQQIQDDISKTTESPPASEGYSTSSSSSSPANEAGGSGRDGSSMSFEIKQEESQVAADALATQSHIKHEASEGFVTADSDKNQHDVTGTASHATEYAPEEPADVAQTGLTHPTATTEAQDIADNEHVSAPNRAVSQVTETPTTDEHLGNAPPTDVDVANVVSEKNENELAVTTSVTNEQELKKASHEEPSATSQAKAIAKPPKSESKKIVATATSNASTSASGRQHVTNHPSGGAAPANTPSGYQYRGRRQSAPNKPKESLKLFGRGPKADQFPEGKDYTYLSPYLSETVLLPEMAVASGVATPALAARSNSADDQVPEEDKLGEENNVDEEDAAEASQERQEATNGGDVDDQEEHAAADQAEEDVTPAAATSAPASVAASERNTPVLAAKNAAAENIQAAKARKKYPYPKVRDPSEFMDLVENYKDMSTPDLYNALSAINSVMVQWQHDYNELRKITDDEDNAVRRRAHDAAYEARVAKDMTRQNAANITLERDFQVRGVRVKEPTYQNEKHYFRQQDRLMAEVYNFEYDPRDSMIGKQDPLLQREGLQNTRLRNRPKQTQKAAEAADEPVTIVTGKRTRKPRNLDDGSNQPSRAATPAEPTKKPAQRRRRGRMAEDPLRAESEVPAEPNGTSNGNVAASQEAPQKKPRGRRGAKAAQEAAAAQALAGDDQETEPEPEDAQQGTYEPEQPKTRKRGRGGRRPAVSRGAKKDDDFVEPPPPAKRQRTKPAAPGAEIPSASFYNNHPSPADTIATPTEEERPTTSSSNGTTQTVESNYSFRERKRKNYNELVSFGDAAPEPKPKRTRRAKAETPVPVPVIPPASSYASVDAPAGPGSAAAPARSASAGPSKPRIRLYNGGGGSSGASNNRSGTPGGPLPAIAPAPVPIPRLASSRGSSSAPSKAPSRKATPAPSAASGSVPPDDAPAKDYAQMTKSEKMSNSMKARWANGSMARAVEKRKATLARKKQQQQEQQQAQQAEQQQAQQQQQLSAVGVAGPPASGGDASGGAAAAAAAAAAPPPILPAAAVPIAAAPLPPAAASSRRG